METILPTTRRPDITFHADGRIYIATRVARILRLSPQSCINIAIDHGEYLLFACHFNRMVGSHAARCHIVNKRGFYYRVNSVRLCRAILRASGASERAALSCGEPVTIDGKIHIPIITKNTL